MLFLKLELATNTKRNAMKIILDLSMEQMPMGDQEKMVERK